MPGREKESELLMEKAMRRARVDLSKEIEPLIHRLRGALEALEQTWKLNHHSHGVNKRAINLARGARGSKPKRLPRGALHNYLRELLAQSTEPLRLTDIRDQVLRQRPFRGRDPKSLYTQIIHALHQMRDVTKNSGGRYSIKR